MGAFEITYNGKLIHSKLAKGNWPLKEHILSFIAKEIENFFLGKPNLSGNYGQDTNNFIEAFDVCKNININKKEINVKNNKNKK